MYSRRDFGKLALAGVPFSMALAARIDSVVNGVRLGASTYCFRDFPRIPGQDDVEATVKALQAVGAGEIELYAPTIEPAGMPLPPEPPRPYGAPPRPASARAADEVELQKSNREALRRWRIQTPGSHYRAVREKFEAGGVSLFAYTMNYNDQFTDEEIDATFEQAKALGVQTIASSMTLSMAKRVAPFADKHQFAVALHGHSRVTDADAFHTPASFAAGMALSKFYRVNLDIGHFTAANQDPVAYIRANHDHITHLHIKDRRRNDGVNEQFGDGDTPIKEVLLLLRELKSPIRAFVEYEYAGLRNSTEETKRSLDYMRRALA
jgi:sugar phosphate isomerase/epimerase